MNQTHSKYYNCNANEAMKQYKFKYRLWYVIEIILTLLIIIWMIWSLGDFIVTRGMANINGDNISSADNGYLLLKLIGVVCLILIILFTRAILYRIETSQLKNVLWNDCDPYKMYEILVLWESFVKRGDVRNNILLLKAQCCRYIPKYQEEGLATLQELDFEMKLIDREASRLLQFAYYSKINGDHESFLKVKTDMEHLPEVYSCKSKFRREGYERALQNLNLQEALWDGKRQEARKLLEALLEQENCRLNKVMLQMELARLDLATEEFENAKQHLEYVITYGNKLPVVSEAKEQIAAFHLY